VFDVVTGHVPLINETLKYNVDGNVPGIVISLGDKQLPVL
jgi:hypothetical protein